MYQDVRNILAGTAWLIALHAANAAAQGTGNDACVLKLSHDAQMVLRAEQKKNRQCIRDNVGDTTRCIDATGVHTATLQARVRAVDASACVPTPRFAYAGGAAISDAARTAANALAHDLFGPFVTKASAPSWVRCRERISYQAGKLAVGKWNELWKCQRRNVRNCSDGAELVTRCLGGANGPQPDMRGILNARKRMLADKAHRQCADVGVPFSVFGGTCASQTTGDGFAGCVSERIDCRVCLAFQTANALSGSDLDCDRFDDGLVNGSCNADCNGACGWCGDGIVQAARNEECDDRNAMNGDGCSAGCIVEHCGDGHLDVGRGEECDDGANEDDDGCSAGCRVEPCGEDECHSHSGGTSACGDGSVQRQKGETCDDGNTFDDDGCSAFCQMEYCGDGYRQAGEECDPGFGAPGCSARCEVEYCGDGIIQEDLDEQCDDGNDDDRDQCSQCVSTTATNTCGNSIRDASEDCDEGKFNGYGMCRGDCRWCTLAEVNQPAAAPFPKERITDLQDTGLFKDVKDPSQGVEPGVRLFEPQYRLWSDAGPLQHGLKTRWIFLPPCKPINNSVQDRWEFPVGTKVWKEFKFKGKRIETRMMQKIAPAADPASWEYLAFRWIYDSQTGAVIRVEKVPDDGAQEGDTDVQEGALQVLQGTLTTPPFPQAIIDLAIARGPEANRRGGTKRIDRADEGHKIPALWECVFCHSRGGDAVLGFDYLQLSTDHDPNAPNAEDAHADPFAGLAIVDLETLKQQRLVTRYEQLITNPRIAARGDDGHAATERAMIGYFHANCGHCHNPQGAAAFTQLRLRFETTRNTPGGHDAITTPVIERGKPTETKIYKRMLSRAEYRQMPPLGTNVQDAEALELLAEWIRTIPPTP